MKIKTTYECKTLINIINLQVDVAKVSGNKHR